MRVELRLGVVAEEPYHQGCRQDEETRAEHVATCHDRVDAEQGEDANECASGIERPIGSAQETQYDCKSDEGEERRKKHEKSLFGPSRPLGDERDVQEIQEYRNRSDRDERDEDNCEPDGNGHAVSCGLFVHRTLRSPESSTSAARGCRSRVNPRSVALPGMTTERLTLIDRDALQPS